MTLRVSMKTIKKSYSMKETWTILSLYKDNKLEISLLWSRIFKEVLTLSDKKLSMVTSEFDQMFKKDWNGFKDWARDKTLLAWMTALVEDIADIIELVTNQGEDSLKSDNLGY